MVNHRVLVLIINNISQYKIKVIHFLNDLLTSAKDEEEN